MRSYVCILWQVQAWKTGFNTFYGVWPLSSWALAKITSRMVDLSKCWESLPIDIRGKCTIVELETQRLADTPKVGDRTVGSFRTMEITVRQPFRGLTHKCFELADASLLVRDSLAVRNPSDEQFGEWSRDWACFCLYRQQYPDPWTLRIASIPGSDPKVVVTFFPAILPEGVKGKVLMAQG